MSLFRRKKKKSLPMHPGNILMIASSSKELYDSTEILIKQGYHTNSDFFRLDNGDYAVVVARE